MERLLCIVRKTIETRKMPLSGRVIVGFSGGPDSTALLLCLRQLPDIEPIALHVNHLMRDDARADVDRCKAICHALSVPFELAEADVPKLAKEKRLNIEEAGREARYESFRTAAIRFGAKIIATGHTQDDRAETVIMNILRGSGLKGLGGIPAVRSDGDLTIVRPLIDAPRNLVHAVARESGLALCRDSTNDDLTRLRVQIRKNVVPVFDQVAPHWKKKLCDLADIAQEDDALLDQFAANLGPNPPEPLVRRALRRQFPELDLAASRTLAKAIVDQSDLKTATPAGLIEVDRGKVRLSIEPIQSPAPMRLANETRWGKHTILMRETPPDPVETSDPMSATIDADKIAGSLVVRSAHPRERMAPLGLNGSKLLSDIFIDRKIPRQDRLLWPLIADNMGIVWFPGYTIAERVKIAKSTTNAVALRVVQNEETIE